MSGGIIDEILTEEEGEVEEEEVEEEIPTPDKKSNLPSSRAQKYLEKIEKYNKGGKITAEQIRNKIYEGFKSDFPDKSVAIDVSCSRLDIKENSRKISRSVTTVYSAISLHEHFMHVSNNYIFNIDIFFPFFGINEKVEDNIGN